MRILIADDEPLVRLGLISMLDELFPKMNRITEAENGHAMIRCCSDTPDVAFVDIKMPLLTGIEAIEQAQKITPNTKWIILTGFSDFEYTREAIRMGVFDYLLKPVGLEQLRDTLSRAYNAELGSAQCIGNKEDIVEKVKIYINLHYMYDIGVNTIADSLNITPNYLSTIFHQQSGQRFVDYISEVRVSAAKRILITNPNITISTLAGKVGYSSPKHFSKVFCKITHVNPSEYLKSLH